MKRYISNPTTLENLDDIECMSKLTAKRADFTVVGDIGKFIHFSAAQHSAGPRVKFWGGTNELNDSTLCPSLRFDQDNIYPIDKSLYPAKKYPSVADTEYVQKVYNFVETMRPILLLVWYRELDESEAQAYFEGRLTFSDLLDEVYTQDYELDDVVRSAQNLVDLHQLCIQHNLYNFPTRR